MITDNTEGDFKFYKNKNSRITSSSTSSKTPTMAELCAEGDRLLAEEEKKSKPLRLKKKDSPLSSQADRYQQARQTIYNKLAPWKKDIIDANKFDDRIYDEFIKEIVALAESTS